MMNLNAVVNHVSDKSKSAPASHGSTHTLETILDRHAEVFSPGLGCLKDVKVHLYKKEDAQPRYFKPRSLPYARKDAVEAELARLESLGIIKSVPHSQYAAPIVPVVKPNGSVRICGDYTLTANASIDAEKYPLPKTDDIFASLAGCRYFSRLDMSDAYNQLELDEDSQKLVTINTTKGLYQYTRLPFGVSSASAVFQRNMEMVLQGRSGVQPFQDDILIGGTSRGDHLTRLDSVLDTLRKSGLKLRKEKCSFVQESLDFLGHHLDATGLHPQTGKVTAIEQAPTPRNIDELRSFLGMVNYYAKFMKDNATRLTPLYELLKKDKDWSWEPKHDEAFKAAKTALTSSQVLVHYDPSKPIHLACDASPVGISAVLSHQINGDERPVAFASRTLSRAEKNYSQIDKEALSIVFGVKKFREYLLGRKFILITDHKPLVSIFSEHRLVPATAALRLQRWALTLSAYAYTIQHKKGALHANADALSRLPLPSPEFEPPVPSEFVLLLTASDISPINSIRIAEETDNDVILSLVKQYVQRSWPKTVEDALKPYHKLRFDITVFNGVLLVSNKVIVPSSLRKAILEELHSSHQGIVATKVLARSKVWWPSINQHIENHVRQCDSCQMAAPMPKSSHTPWPQATKPWQRLHIDFAGPLEGKFLLITVDAHTKWLEADITSSTSTVAVVTHLRQHIARFGLFETLVTDNGTCFASREFAEFTKANGIRHLFTAPYHPASNGQAERAVRTVKTTLQKITGGTSEGVTLVETGLGRFSDGPLETRIARLLLNYRRTPQASGQSPAELLLGRPLRTRLDLIHPGNKLFPSPLPPSAGFSVAQPVFARNFGRGKRWIPGTIIAPIGSTMFEILTEHGSLRRHTNQIRSRTISTDVETPPNAQTTTEVTTPNFQSPVFVPKQMLVAYQGTQTPVGVVNIPALPNQAPLLVNEPNHIPLEVNDLPPEMHPVAPYLSDNGMQSRTILIRKNYTPEAPRHETSQHSVDPTEPATTSSSANITPQTVPELSHMNDVPKPPTRKSTRKKTKTVKMNI